VTPGEILDDIAPELVDATGKATHLELAEGQTGKVYGDQRNYAVALLAAHTLTVTSRGGNSGAAAMLKEGNLQIQFNQSADTGQLGVTSYGAELSRLRRQYIMGARTVLV